MNEANRKRRIPDLRYPMDHAAMLAVLDEFVERYPQLSVTTLGHSMLGRWIPAVRLGAPETEGRERRRVLYIGAHHGMEWITTTVLLRFINEYGELLKSDGLAEGVRVRALNESCGIYIVPMLNPDGVDYAINGLSEDNPLRERVIRMNGGSEDLTRWQANARGVDLNHNYNADFAAYKQLEAEQGITGGAPTRFSGERPESEPETAYLCNYLRFSQPFDAVLTLHTQGEEIYCATKEARDARTEALAQYISRVTGYTFSEPSGPAAYGGFTDWFLKEFGRPCFTLECGKGSNPLPVSMMPQMYLRLRRVLFSLPTVV